MARWVLWVVLFSASCASPVPANSADSGGPRTGVPQEAASTPKCPSAETLTSQITALATRRDDAGLEALRECARENAGALAQLARAIYWTSGVSQAQPDLAAVCSDERLAKDSEERTEACATLTFAELAAGRTLNTLQSGGQAPFLPQQKLFIALVAVNALPPEPFIVDTGAPTTVISQRYAERVGIAYRGDVAQRSTDASGNAVALYPTVLDSVRWGEVEVKAVPAHVLALPENFRVGGILAPQDLLRGTSFEIDGPSRVLRVPAPGTAASAPSGSMDARLLWSGGNPHIEARVDELPPLPFLLDSGAGGMGLCEGVLMHYGKALTGGEIGQSATAAGSAAVRTGLEVTLAVGSDAARPFSFFVQACPTDPEASVEKAGYVGAPWFWERRVYFPEHRRHVSFTPGPEASLSPASKMH